MIDGYLTSDQAAERLGVTRRTLYNLFRNSPGFPQPERVGRALVWRAEPLDEWRRTHPPRQKPKREARKPVE